MLSFGIVLSVLLILFMLLGISTIIPGPPDSAMVLNASHTKTADFNGAWLDLGVGFELNTLGIPAAAVINVTACDRANSDETYAFVLQEASPDASGVVDAATAANIGAIYSVPVSGATATLGILLAKGLITKRFVRLVLDVGGTTPSITYSANLARG